MALKTYVQEVFSNFETFAKQTGLPLPRLVDDPSTDFDYDVTATEIRVKKQKIPAYTFAERLFAHWLCMLYGACEGDKNCKSIRDRIACFIAVGFLKASGHSGVWPKIHDENQ